MQITKIFLASFCLLLITVGANASPTNLTRRADNPALSQSDADVFLQQLNTEIKEIFDGRSSDPGKDELRRRLLELPDLKFYFSSLINDIKEIVDSFTPIKDFLSQAGYATAYAEVLLQCSEQNIRDGNWVSCVSHQLSFAARLGLESGCYFLSQTPRFQDSPTQNAVCGFGAAYLAASIRYMLTSKTALLGLISQHFDRFMQSALVGNFAEAWRQINFLVAEQGRILEIHPIVEAWQKSMGIMMNGEQPPVGDLQFAGLLPPRFAIQNIQTGLCIHPKDGDTDLPDGTMAHLWSGCDADYVKYEFTRTGAIRHVKSGKCLHPNQGKSDRGTRFHFWTGCDLDYLPFQLRADGNLVHVKTNYCLVPVGTSRPSEGTQLNIWDYCAQDARTTYTIVA